jgi:hypothetical protein
MVEVASDKDSLGRSVRSMVLSFGDVHETF